MRFSLFKLTIFLSVFLIPTSPSVNDSSTFSFRYIILIIFLYFWLFSKTVKYTFVFFFIFLQELNLILLFPIPYLFLMKWIQEKMRLLLLSSQIGTHLIWKDWLQQERIQVGKPHGQNGIIGTGKLEKCKITYVQ